MDFTDEAQNELAEQSASTGFGQPRGKVRKRATIEPLTQEAQQSQRPESFQRRQTHDRPDAIMAGIDEAAKERRLQQLKKQWRKAGRPNCAECNISHPPPCDPDMIEERRRLQELKASDPDEYNRQMDAKTATRKQKQEVHNAARTEEVHASISAAGKTPRQRANFADSIEGPPGRTKLPSDFCLQCLACHPFKSGKGTYHIRTFKDNLEMHKAISLGKLPKVDPWENFLKAFKLPSPKPEPDQAHEHQGLCTGTFELSESMRKAYEEATDGLHPFEKVKALNELLDRQDRFNEDQRKQSAMQAQQAPETQRFGPYATAATTGGYSSYYPLPTERRPRSPQPTGPPTRKRKAGNTNEGSGRAYKGARLGGAHTASLQAAGNQRANAAQTPQPNTTPAPNTDWRQRTSSNPLDNVQRTGQTKSLNITNVPITGALTKPLAKGDATAAKNAVEQAAAEKAADDEATAKKAAPNDNRPT
jgi:hypothetical protein